MSQRPFLVVPSLLLLLAAPLFADDPSTAPPAAAAKEGPVDLSAPVAPAAPKGDPDELARQLADTQDKLATALHSYTLLQDENGQLKADAEKNAADKAALQAQIADGNNSISALKAQAAAATQVDGLRDQLRQSQNQIAALAAENADLRTRLALTNSTPAGAVFPQRPSAESAPMSGPDGASRAAAPPAGATRDEAKADTPPADAAKMDETKAAPRIYTVVAGDSLSKISKKCYGTAKRWNEILAANRDVIKNENTVIVGAKLKIP